MNGFLFSLALTAVGVVAITVVAVAVELRRRRQRGPLPLSMPRAVHVDVDFDQLPGLPLPDNVHRQATLDRALDRMSRAPAAGWIETRPMVAPAPQGETARP
ncbi:MAG: hypothetical protein KGL18_13690 [Burkholderiales bacterium]|nr:hypothetical protein [Burkholderiales bacterium]MDE1928536.1 hypothetical protein [Burkholderiales bacterium]MDE2504010.1 hypothetical protein [Burkholderiales bacterium]